MDIKGFPALIVGVVVALVLAGAVLPVFAETTSATDTFMNDGLIYATNLDADTVATIVWDYAKPNILTVNDVDMTVPTGSLWPLTVAFTESYLVRLYPETTGGYIQIIDVESGASQASAFVSGNTGMDITISGGTLTATVNNVSKTFTGTAGLIISDKGDYVLKKSDDSAYIKDDSIVYCAGYTWHGLDNSVNLVNIFTYSVEDSVGIQGSYPPSFTYSETIDNPAVSSYINLYSFKSITMEIEDEDDNTGTAVYSQVFVPAEVSAEKVAHPDATLSTLLNILPLLAIAGLVTGAVVWFISRKG